VWRGGAGVRVEGSAAGAAWGPAATSRPCVAAPLAAAPFHLRRRCVSSIVSHGCVGDTSWSGRSLPRIHRCCPDGRPMRVAKQRRGWRQHHLCHHVHIPTSESMAEQGESRRRDSTIVRRPGVVLPIAVYLRPSRIQKRIWCACNYYLSIRPIGFAKRGRSPLEGGVPHCHSEWSVNYDI